MHISLLSKKGFFRTIGWAVLLSCLIVAVAATLARATLSLKAALTDDDADLAVFLLLPEEGVTDVELLRAGLDDRDYLVETEEKGKKLVHLKRDLKWYVTDVVPLRKGPSDK